MAKHGLMVDDSATVRQALRRTLEKEGYEIIKAENGKYALEAFPIQGGYMVVTDFNLLD